MTSNQIAYANLLEQRRANQAREGETYRSNLAKEGFNYAQLIENTRHNTVSENTELGKLWETQRSNQAREYETHRSNVANEYLKQYGTNMQYLASSQATQQRRDQAYQQYLLGTQNTNIAKQELAIKQTDSLFRNTGEAVKWVTGIGGLFSGNKK